LKEPLQHREFFQHVALMSKKERLTVIKGYAKANQTRGIVHAISQLPRQQGQTLMRDLIIKEDGKKDRHALEEVLFWLRDAGAQLRAMEKSRRRRRNDDTDEAVVDVFEDVADALSDAVTSVADAVAGAVGSIAGAIADVVNWVADEVTDLVRALVEAGRTCLSSLKVQSRSGMSS
jgi:hypothetical protein